MEKSHKISLILSEYIGLLTKKVLFSRNFGILLKNLKNSPAKTQKLAGETQKLAFSAEFPV